MARGPAPFSSALLVCVMSCVTVAAHAEPQLVPGSDLPDPVSAEALFDSGRQAMAEGRLEEACARFLESHRLEPALGTLLNLAVCEERRQLYASAWQRFRRLLESLPAGDDRRDFVVERLKAAEAKLARVTLKLPASSPAGLRVLKGGVRLTPGSFGIALPFDPGPLRFEISAPKHVTRALEVVVQPGEQRELLLAPGPLLVSDTASPIIEPPASRSGTASPPPPDERPASAGSFKATAGYIAVGTGAAGVVASLVMGYAAIRASNTLDSSCSRVGEELQCNDEGLAAAKRAKLLATMADVSFAAGAALAGIGVYLVLTAPAASKVSSAAITTRLAW